MCILRLGCCNGFCLVCFDMYFFYLFEPIVGRLNSEYMFLFLRCYSTINRGDLVMKPSELS